MDRTTLQVEGYSARDGQDSLLVEGRRATAGYGSTSARNGRGSLLTLLTIGAEGKR